VEERLFFTLSHTVPITKSETDPKILRCCELNFCAESEGAHSVSALYLDMGFQKRMSQAVSTFGPLLEGVSALDSAGASSAKSPS
jgi:hypothetical protein